ncbi:MAG: autotransporter-associated beta strand repeat-containing protein [Thermoguttaceae bacterium]|nr:autotransporter-associated beta strand repeat-containing protein [Thermoguttaceae bacterium]
MTSFLRTRILFSLVLGLFVLTASAMADVTFNGTTFTGYGTYDQAVNATSNLSATPTFHQETDPDTGEPVTIPLTFTNNIVSTGNFTQTGENLVFGAGTVNSFNALYINNGSGNGARMTLSGSMTLAELRMANTKTTNLDITDGASLSVSGTVRLNEAKNAQGNITQTGGTVSFTISDTPEKSTEIRIGHYPNTGYPSRYNISGGSLSIPNTTTYLGWDGRAEMNISGGEVSLKGLSISNSSGGRGVFTLRGGTFNIGDGGVVRNKRNASSPAAAEVYLGQGTIHATATQTWGSNLTMSLYGRSADDTADVAGGVTTFDVDEGKTITIPSAISGVGALTKTGAGTLTLSGANTYTGATTISAGTLELTGNGTLGTGAVTDSGTLKFNYSADKTLANVISGTGTIIKEGTNAVKLDGTFTSYEGNMTINGGKISIYANDSKKFYIKNISGSGDLELRLAGPTGGRDVQLPNLTNDGFTGYISLVQEGALNGNKIATGGKTYEGFKFKVNDGTSIFVNGEFKADSYISGNGNYENRGAIRLYNNLSGNIIVTADANIGFQGARTISGSISSGAASGEVTLFINGKTDGTTVTANRDAGTYTGAISDGTSGSKLGIRIVSSTHTFSGALSYTGATTVNAGTTMNLFGANANLVNSRAAAIDGKLNFSSYTGSSAMQLNDLSGTTAASEILGTDKNLILNNNNDTSYAGAIRIGSGTFTKTGTGTLTLSGIVAYSGATTVSAGTLDLAGKDAIATSTAVVNNAAITASEDQTFRNLSGAGSITMSNKDVTLVSPAGSAYSGTISGVNTLTVDANSVYDLSGATVSAANFETKTGASVNVSSEKPVTVTNSFRQGNAANYTISGGSASISGENVAQQATIALNGGTMSINSYDFTAPTLPEISSLAVHLDASDASSFDNSSSITTWKNLANPSNSLTFLGYGGSTSHAYVTEAGQNGLNVMTFPANGTAYYNMASVVNGKTFFAVMADNGFTASNGYSFLFGNNSNGSVNGHNPYCFHRGAGTVLWNTSHLDGNIKTSGVTSLNGTPVAHADANIGTDWNVLTIQATGTVPVSAISRERTNLTEARGWRGDIAEILVYTDILTDAQVQEVNQYLATKWNVGNDIVEPTVVTTGEFVSTNAINVLADSTIDVGGFTSVTFGSTSIDEGKTLTINVAKYLETVWTSPISGDGSLTKSGNGTLSLSREPSYNGATTVEAGTLALTEGGTLNNLSGGSLNPDGTIAQSAFLDATGKDLTFVNSETTKFVGSIKANNLVIDGGGTLQIYTGADGQVDVQSLTVSSGNLDVKGYMKGNITVKSGTVFSPGNSVGEATFNGSFTLEDAATLLIEQDATGMDKLTASSYFIDPNSILELTAGAAASGATYAIIVQKDGDNPVNFVDDLATDIFWNSLLTPESDYYWNLSVVNNVVYATMDSNAVPEPSTWALLILGVAGLMYWRRKNA